MPEVELTYQKHPRVAQPRGNDPKRSYRVIGPSCRHDQIKIKPAKLKIEHLNNKRGQNGKRTYLGHMHITQPPKSPLKHLYRVIGLVRWQWRHGQIEIASGKLKIEHISISQRQQDIEMTYLQHMHATQPPQNPSICACGVVGPKH